MSRGLGKIQHRLIKILRAHPGHLDTFELTARVYELSPDERGHVVLSHVQVGAVRRALRALVNKGIIATVGRHWRGGRQHWANPEAAARYHERVSTVFGREITATSFHDG